VYLDSALSKTPAHALYDDIFAFLGQSVWCEWEGGKVWCGWEGGRVCGVGGWEGECGVGGW
jgi:hypothetical protein